MSRTKSGKAATPAEHAKAWRIRQARDGKPTAAGQPRKPPTQEQVRWLQTFEARHRPGNTRFSRAPQASLFDAQSSKPSEPGTQSESSYASEPSGSPSSAAPTGSTSTASEYTPVDADTALVVPSHDARPSCPFPTCRHCLNGEPRPHLDAGVMGKCGVTGKKVYEPLSDNGARFYAAAAFLVPMYGAYGVRRLMGETNVPIVEPDDEDMDDGAKAVKAVIERRAPAAAAYDDLAQLALAFGAFGVRAFRQKGAAT